jgi:L-2-amino-thiazoline-4-carboxylic acid hydrolase
MSVPIIEQAKIQARVLVPLVKAKALQAELGERQANALVRRALGDTYRRYGEEFWRTKRDKNVGDVMASAFATFARGEALDYQVREQSQDVFAIDVTGCRSLSSRGSWANRSSGFSSCAARTF